MNMSVKKWPPVKCLEDVFLAAGSATKLAAKLDLHANTVEAWRRAGIPTKYWDKIHELYGFTPGELYMLSKACRRTVTSPSRVK